VTHEEWIRAHVEPTGAIETVHERPWSRVLRVPTAGGDLFFKVNARRFAHEARVIDTLARHRPELLPELVAADLERGWMLLADAGDRIRDRPDAAVWPRLLADYAELQIDAVRDADALVAGGVPDGRLARLPELYEEAGGRDVPMVEELCAALGETGLPATIQHDDLHDANVFVRGGRYRIMDWGDSVVSHPLVSIGEAEPFAGEAGVRAYLEPWTRFAPLERLREAIPIAKRLAGVTRAWTWAAIEPTAPPELLAQHGDYGEIWLRRVAMPPEEWN
jgi:phosphotransferase family enzyme